MTDLRIEKLDRRHAVEAFDCGTEALNRFLLRHALATQQSDAGATYVAVSGQHVVGYYTLVVGEAAFDGVPSRLAKGLARHPVPLMLLARLAVHRDWQGKGVGAGLLKDALRRTVQAADIVGIRALAVHAKDAEACTFYQHFDFIDSPTDPLHLFLLLKDLRRVVR